MSQPRMVIAGLRGGSGKTLLAVGLAAALVKRGLSVVPFKKGPDYIDAAWLSMAAGRPCRNLDLFLMSPETALQSFVTAAGDCDVALIEGNRGLYDGMNAQGSFSTAELAKLLKSPVVLTVDCTKTTRTTAASVLGCQKLDPQVSLAGVILNRTAGTRHESVLREAIQQSCGLPVLGAIPRLHAPIFPERHLGLVPPPEHEQWSHAIRQASDIAREYLDIEAIRRIASRATPIVLPTELAPIGHAGSSMSESPVVCIGLFRDAAFQFYYPENLEALVRAGAELIEVSPLDTKTLPQVDGLYIGGGFPETLASRLAQNRPFRESLRHRIAAGLPVYAECGGAVFLGQRLLFEENAYPMVGVLPVSFAFQSRPKGHGYAEVETVAENPFFTVGTRLRGHEFHYTYVESASTPDLTYAFRVQRGYGFDGQHDGLCYKNVLASYTHLHALGTPAWAASVVRTAHQFRANQESGRVANPSCFGCGPRPR